jgi:hypothetical protein
MWTTANSTTCLQVRRVTRAATIADFQGKARNPIFVKELSTGARACHGPAGYVVMVHIILRGSTLWHFAAVGVCS